MKPVAALCKAASLVLAGSVALAVRAPALSARDGTRVQRVVVGRGSALAACDGLESSNANRARTRFPRNAELAFRGRLSGGIGQAPASDSAGNLIVAHGEPRLSKLGPKAQTLWSERLPSEASCAPVVLANGAILIVTRDGDALYFSSSGKLEHKHALPFSETSRHTVAIPTGSGGALVARGSELVQLDAEGRVERRTRAKTDVSALAESGSNLVAIGADGSVQLARASGDFETVGGFGGAVTDGAAVRAGSVFAIVDAHKWLALDLNDGQVTTLATDSALTLTGPAALFATQGAALIADGGFVSTRRGDGSEALRIPLSNFGAGFDPALRGLRPALVISDRDGALAAVRSGSDALVVSPEGSVVHIESTSCLDPFRPTPTPSGLVFTCRSGQLFGVSDKAP